MLRASSFDIGGKRVSDPTHGLDQRWSVRIFFDLFAQPRDQIVYRSIKRRPIMAFEKIHDIIARQHAMRPLHKSLQQVELAGSEVLLIAVPAFQAAAGDIQDPPSNA